MQKIQRFFRVTASKVSIFYVLHDSIIVLCIINSIAGDADALVRGSLVQTE